MTAAEAIFEHLRTSGGSEVVGYPERLRHTWLWEELYRVRNIRPSFHWGLYAAFAYSALDTYLLRGKAPWTLQNHADHTQLKTISECEPIAYPRPDGKITFDRLSSVFVSNTNHENDQPSHLKLRDRNRVSDAQLPASPHRRATAGVSRFVRGTIVPAPQIAQNCVHCGP
jgi:electron-transferring-flavoprotein dehydrogenase